MPRPRRSEQELQTAANHVGYEIEMLMHAGRYVGVGHGSPATMPSGNDRNMALESFLLHFRNLRAFLCPSLQGLGLDDIVASDYLDRTEREDVGNPDKFRTEKRRLDKMLAHLSYTRAEYITAGNYFWPGAMMTRDIVDEMATFVLKLPETRKSWFPSIPKLQGYRSEASSFLSADNAGTVVFQGWCSARYPGS